MSAGAAGDRQKEHYENLHDDYEAHYYDEWSMQFRRRYMYDYLLGDMDLNGAAVADFACGSGHNSIELQRRFPTVQLHGYDVSDVACAAYRDNTGATAHAMDLTQPFRFEVAHDAAIVVGGLHHCVSDLEQTLGNIAAAIKPGGWLMMVEPNRRYMLEVLRALWYRYDSYFDHATEQALDHDELLAQAEPRFALDALRFAGGPAYFLVLNSLIFRLPKVVKRTLAAPLWAAEDLYNLLPGRRPFPYFAARWRRR